MNLVLEIVNSTHFKQEMASTTTANVSVFISHARACCCC